MSGATVNHKTDIWYSYLAGNNFEAWTEPDLDSNSTRRNLTDTARFSTPVRVTDNAACKLEPETDEEENVVTDDNNNIVPARDEEGNLIYNGAPYCQDRTSGTWIDQPEKKIPLTLLSNEGYPLDGDTGASRPNMFLIPNGDSARVVLAYEESKGLGKGPGDNHYEEDATVTPAPADREDWGKNIYYHTFPFDQPDEVRHGLRINLPTLNENKEPVLTEDETEFLTANARRVRIIQQPEKNWNEQQLAIVLLYREGEEGHGHPAHIIMRRFVGGYDPEFLECTKNRKHPNTKEDVCVEGSLDLNEDNTPDPDAEFDNARAHRGFLRGDMLVVGYTYTSKWGRGFPKSYDFFVRRSFDGGKKWTNFKGINEDPVNLSNIKDEGNRGWSVMEPRLYATPGTIGKPPKSPMDVQNPMVYYAAYSTTHNPHVPDDDEVYDEDEKDEPMDLYWTMTDNFGESYMKVWNAEANDGEGKWEYPWLAKVKGDDDVAGFAGVQIRTNPAGSKLFAAFQADVISTVVETGGGPCRGNGYGSDVCSNRAETGDTLLTVYDLDGNDAVNELDLAPLQLEAFKQEQGEVVDLGTFDLNKDGDINGHDFKLLEAAIEQYAKRSTRRRARLRGRQ